MSPRRGNAIARRSERSNAPLSFAQQRLWYLDQIEPGLTAYTIRRGFRIVGAPLDYDALRRALNEIVRRHEVLRTAFTVRGDTPSQQVADTLALDLPIVDLSDLPRDGREKRLQELCPSEAARPFVLGELPLIRATLFRLSEDEHTLLVIVHHIVFDGASIAIFLNELGALYAAFNAGEDSPLDELEVQYADYAIWEREFLSGAELDKRLEFWRPALAGSPTATELPIGRARPATQTFVGADRIRRLPADLLDGLRALAATEGATLFMLLLAGFKAVLFRYSGQEDVVVGSPTGNRNRLEVEQLIGFFVNDLVLRTAVSDDQTFRQLLQSVRSTCMGAFGHQDLPFERLVQEMRPHRDLSRTPLFQLMFDVQGAPPALNLPGLEVRREPVCRNTSHFDLTLTVQGTGDGAEACANYNLDLFDAEAIDALLGHFETLLAGAVADPDRKIATLPLLTTDEQRQAITGWNDTRAEFPEARCVHELIEAQVRRTPNAAAIAFRRQSLTFDRLNRDANRLARDLVDMGVGPGTLVGVFIERSIDMVVALLAVLKAGGAYVPLDPSYPRRRLETMLEDAGAAVVLTQEGLKRSVPGQVPLVVVDAYTEAAGNPADADLGPRATPDDLAYVIYTSGSTGKPKGVMVRHRNVVNFFTAMDERLAAGKVDRRVDGNDEDVANGEEQSVWLAVTSISFDISVLELFWTLSRGFKVVVQSEEAMTTVSATATASAPKPTRFSLFYFSADEEDAGDDKYRLLIEGAKFADAQGFEAVWTPERHFHSFGGLYPNPAVTGAAIAALTRQVKIRAGSVVLPLHDPIRVAEEWSVVDNLSGGRVGVSVASGWHDRDFVFAPERYGDRWEAMFRGVETVKALWWGDPITRHSGSNEEIEVRIRPRPVQQELPLWVTASGSPATIERREPAPWVRTC